jgi:hypothetical protein
MPAVCGADRIMGGNPVFRGTRVPVHMLAELVPSRVRAHASSDGKCWPGRPGKLPDKAPVVTSAANPHYHKRTKRREGCNRQQPIPSDWP